MLQLFRSLRQRFRRNRPQPSCPAASVPTVDWASIIWGYVSSFYKKDWSLACSNRARKEFEDRGLAYGQVCVTGGDKHCVEIFPLGEQKLTTTQVKDALTKAVGTLGLAEEVSVQDGHIEGVELIIKGNSTLKGLWSGGNDTQDSYIVIAQAVCWDSGGLHEMRASNELGLRVLLYALASLGFPVGQKHYSHESPVKIEDVAVYAVRWEDPQTKCRYLDVLWRPEFIKHQVWHGVNRHHERIEGPYQGEVIACLPNGNSWPRMSINNRPVYSTIVENPTIHVLEAKEKFVKESVRVCSYCGKLASREFNHVHFEMTDGAGTSGMGGISYGCDNPDCAAKAKEQKSLRTEERPYTQEVWS